jgi:predicted TIM-barrel fold metal-dependent hydrolase
MEAFNLIPPVGFMFDTTLAFAHMIFSGFLDKYPNLKLIAAHAGAALPYLAGRFDICHEKILPALPSSRTSQVAICGAYITTRWCTTRQRSNCA